MSTTLNNNEKIPQIGLGTWELADEKILLEALDVAYTAGYRHFDTARIYHNEEIIGKFIRRIPRESIFLTSKLWIDSLENVEKACDESLRKLQTDYLDLYLVHWPISCNCDFDIEKIWRQMENLVKINKVKSIGVCNFGIFNLGKLLKICKIKPAMLQVELHPYLPQKELTDFCKENKIAITSYSTLGSSRNSKVLVREDETIKRIAEKHNCTPSQVLLSDAISRGYVVIPRSGNKKHIIENLQIINIDNEDREIIDKIDFRCRYVDMEPHYGEDIFD